MESIDINSILNRQQEIQNLKTILTDFDVNKTNLSTKRGIYIYGDPGSGKTTFVTNVLKELNYDIVKYDAGDIRNKAVIENITKHNMGDRNIMSMFNKIPKKIAIVMDEIDGMNSGDKGGINTLIKIIRPKKTKKQKQEEITMNPIICIGNYHMDKKIKELMKVCNVIELKSPTLIQTSNLVNTIMPMLEQNIKDNIISFVQGDLRKLKTIYEIYKKKQNVLNNNIIQNIFQMKSYNDDTRKITQKLVNNHYGINEHLTLMNETDRTIVGLLWHENIVDVLDKEHKELTIPFYTEFLDNICFSDYIDRITFQKQIWQFNEMSSLIKTFKNNMVYHDTFKKKQKYNPSEVRFTKVLTKYSTEYNNSVFIQGLCQQLNIDKKDLFAFFLELRTKYKDDNELCNLFENYEISKLDINRIYRYLDKYIKENSADTIDIEISDDEYEAVE